jgi:hypothetical protein
MTPSHITSMRTLPMRISRWKVLTSEDSSKPNKSRMKRRSITSTCYRSHMSTIRTSRTIIWNQEVGWILSLIRFRSIKTGSNLTRPRKSTKREKVIRERMKCIIKKNHLLSKTF